jgi:hypothetical protein
MAKKQDKAPMALETILLGPVQLDRAWLEQAPEVDVTQAGIVLCNERQKHTIKIMAGQVPVGVTITLSITREPWGVEEQAKVDAVKDVRKLEKATRDQQAAETLAKEKRTMFELGSQSSSQAIMNTLGSVDKLIAVGQLVNNLTQNKLSN